MKNTKPAESFECYSAEVCFCLATIVEIGCNFEI